MDLDEPAIDFVGFARALGVAAEHTTTLDEVQNIFSHTLTAAGPVLLDVQIEPGVLRRPNRRKKPSRAGIAFAFWLPPQHTLVFVSSGKARPLLLCEGGPGTPLMGVQRNRVLTASGGARQRRWVGEVDEARSRRWATDANDATSSSPRPVRAPERPRRRSWPAVEALIVTTIDGASEEALDCDQGMES